MPHRSFRDIDVSLIRESITDLKAGAELEALIELARSREPVGWESRSANPSPYQHYCEWCNNWGSLRHLCSNMKQHYGMKGDLQE